MAAAVAVLMVRIPTVGGRRSGFGAFISAAGGALGVVLVSMAAVSQIVSFYEKLRIK